MDQGRADARRQQSDRKNGTVIRQALAKDHPSRIGGSFGSAFPRLSDRDDALAINPLPDRLVWLAMTWPALIIMFVMLGAFGDP